MLHANLDRFEATLAQNIFLAEEAAFNDARAFDPAFSSNEQGIEGIDDYRVAVIVSVSLCADRAPKAIARRTRLGIRDEESRSWSIRSGDDKVDAVVLLA